LSRKTAVIIGNGKLSRDLSPFVDASDFTMRFNEPKMSIGWSGTRTDLLMLATSSKPMQRRLQDVAFLHSPTFQAAREIMLAYHPSIIRRFHPKPNLLSRLKGRRSDWTAMTIDIVGGLGKEIRVMPPQFYIDGCAELGIPETKMREIFPSTGFFGIRHVLQTLSEGEWDVKLCGFSWEGWRRHSWGDERRWVEDKVRSGRLGILE
jgi:hypothetical protein